MYIDELGDMVNKYSNIYHRTIKTKPVDVKSSMYTGFNKENNKEGPKVKVSDHVRTSKYKNIFEKKVPFQIGLTYVINNLNVEEIVGTF